MSKRLLTAAAAVVVLAAFAETATGAPTPDYTVACAIGGQSGVTWNHAKLSSVTFDWTTTGSPVSTSVPVFSAHPPRGFIVTVTPAGATNLTVTFQHANDSGTDQLTQACS